MGYSARQQHFLRAMGLVAWTCEHKAALEAAPSADTIAEAGRAEATAADIDSPAPALSYSRETLAQWLVEQSLAPFVYRGSTVNCIGSEHALLAVVCIQGDGMGDVNTHSSPLSKDCASLFNLMMKAIELPATAIRQCVVRCPVVGAPADAPASQAGLELVLTSTIKAVLVLDIHDDWHETDSAPVFSNLPGSQLPLWRIPHPELLLDKPSLKRHAWEGLKALQQTLNQQHS